jgi:polygalacturonase
LKFGAKTDGITNSGKAFAEAISAASEKGGGIVYFPKGDYMTGPIHLKSNVTLNINSKNILIQGLTIRNSPF